MKEGGSLPEHPGEYLARVYLSPNNISANKASSMLGLSPSSVSRLVLGHLGVTAQMAIRLSYVFGETPEAWIERQFKYGLAEARLGLGDVKRKIDLTELRPLKK